MGGESVTTQPPWPLVHSQSWDCGCNNIMVPSVNNTAFLVNTETDQLSIGRARIKCLLAETSVSLLI